MKKRFLYPALCLQLLLAAVVVRAQPGWVNDPAPYQYSMTMVAQIQVDDVPNHQLNNHLGAFRQGQIRGYSTPVGFNGEAYYFLSFFSNTYKGDTLYFRAFLGADQKVYESVDTVVFQHHLALGTASEPVQIHLYLGNRPLIFSLPNIEYLATGCVDVADVEATDNQNTEGNGLTYIIVGGADAARFEIEPQTGVLSWLNFLPHPGLPEDANGDNRYEVEVRVTDASDLYDVQHITVTVLPASVPPTQLVCPVSQTLSTSADGTGDCGTTADQTSLSLSNICAESSLIYEMSGATSGSGTGQVPTNQVFAVGQTTIYYFLNGQECVFTIQVQDDEPPTIACPANQSVSPTIFNPCSAVVSGIDAIFGDNCPNAGVGYVLSGATTGSGLGQASGQTFQLGSTLVTYTVADGADLGATCSFTVTVSECNTEFSGTIYWEHDGVNGVQNATVNLTGSAADSDITDGDGDYLIPLPNYLVGNFTLKPTKNINKLNGVTTADVTAIQQHVANTTLLPAPFKRIAADVNKSNSITSLDATLLNQALLGNPSALSQITSWRFVPASYTFPNPGVPWGFPEQIDLTDVGGSISGQDFFGIKLGDVVATWANPANFGPDEPLVFRLEDKVLESGGDVVAEFRADQSNDLNSFQFALHFHPEQLQLVEIEPLTGLPVSVEHFGTYNLAEGEIRVAWAQAASVLLNEAAPVFRLRFKALESGARLSEVLQLNEEVLPAHVYNSAYEESGVELQYWTTTSTNYGADTPVLLLENRPNPFNDVTVLRFMLPEACEAELRVSDATGKLLFSQKKYYAAGRQEETLPLNGATGVLFAELVTEKGSVVRKMLAVQN